MNGSEIAIKETDASLTRNITTNPVVDNINKTGSDDGSEKEAHYSQIPKSGMDDDSEIEVHYSPIPNMENEEEENEWLDKIAHYGEKYWDLREKHAKENWTEREQQIDEMTRRIAFQRHEHRRLEKENKTREANILETQFSLYILERETVLENDTNEDFDDYMIKATTDWNKKKGLETEKRKSFYNKRG